MRREGTHTERELKELDRRIRDAFNELKDDVRRYERDGVGLGIAYARPQVTRKDGERAVYGVTVAGSSAAVAASLAELFDHEPELFMDVLGRVSEKSPDMFQMHVVQRPKDERILS